jgi:NAD(P)-dependent dehydrogenase (short-subunit alcohol dehydrogenase family)
MAALTGRVAVVTGASRGIGKGCAIELGALGATVYVTGRSASKGAHPLGGTVAETAAAVTAAGGRGVAVVCDHRDDGQVRRLFRQVETEQGRLDVLVNNAFLIPKELTSGKPFWEVPLSNWDDMLDVGTRSAYVASHFAAKLMVPARRGLIANISSSGAREYAWHVAYGVGKCALDRLTADCAHELRPHGVAVVSLWPGLVLTERLASAARSEPQASGVSAAASAARSEPQASGASAGASAARSEPQASGASAGASAARSEPQASRGGADAAQAALPKLDFSGAESQRFTGRAVAALASDPEVLRWSGRALASRELADVYGFVDVDGRLPKGPLHDRPQAAR